MVCVIDERGGTGHGNGCVRFGVTVEAKSQIRRGNEIVNQTLRDRLVRIGLAIGLAAPWATGGPVKGVGSTRCRV